MDSVSAGHRIQLAALADIESYAEDLQARFQGCTVSVKQHSLVILSRERMPLLPFMLYFHDKGIEVYEAKELKPTLEDVFVRVTGIESEHLKKEKTEAGK